MQKFLYLILLLPITSQAQLNIDSLTPKIDTIFKKYVRTEGPGCAVAIIKNGSVIFEKSYGMANLEYSQPISPASLFDIGSLTKQFTGFAISTLVQEGKISLDDDIHRYLPQVPDLRKRITLSQLIHHSSGLRDYPEALMMAGWRYNELCTLDDVMKLIKYQRELDFEPGSKFAYCNTGYVLLAAIVEKVTGQSFPAWTKEHIFKPLGMNSSFILDNSRTVIPNLATSYTPTNDGYLKYEDILTAYGSSCMYSSLHDLTKWAIHFQERLAAKDPVFLRMVETGLLNNGEKVSYGFGLNLDEYQGLEMLWHSGAWAGYRTIILHYPEQRFAVVILCNADDNAISGPDVNQVATIFLRNDFRPPNAGEFQRIKALPAIRLSTNLLQKYVGTYAPDGQDNIRISFTIENGQLTGHNGPNNFLMEAKNDSCFYLAAENATITFANRGGEIANGFTFRNESISKHSTRTTGNVVPAKFNPSPKELTAYTGAYFSDELQTFYIVDTVGGTLMIHHFRRGNFELHPKQDKQGGFTSEIGAIDFYLNAKKQVSGLMITGDRVKNMRFIKK